jgi:hypothetical protein
VDLVPEAVEYLDKTLGTHTGVISDLENVVLEVEILFPFLLGRRAPEYYPDGLVLVAQDSPDRITVKQQGFRDG